MRAYFVIAGALLILGLASCSKKSPRDQQSEEVQQMTQFITNADVQTKGLLGYFVGAANSSHPALRKDLGPECVSALIQIIENRRDSTNRNEQMARSGAIFVLGVLDDKKAARAALPLLERLTKDPDASVVEEAQRAITNINKPK